MADPVAWYDANAETAAARYERVRPERLHGWVAELLPAAPATALDVACSSSVASPTRTTWNDPRAVDPDGGALPGALDASP